MISHKCPICEIMADFLKSKNKSRLDLRFQTKLEKVDAKGGHQTLELVVFSIIMFQLYYLFDSLL